MSLILSSLFFVSISVLARPLSAPLAGGSTSDHTNNWAVLVCASRYWFNYRLSLCRYRTVKRLGIPDSNIILMLADDAACNSRNKFPGSVYAKPGRGLDLYGDNIEVDYRGYEVTVENLLRVLTGRMEPSVPRSKRLLTDARSNIFVYMTGHGGDEFLKFQDNEELSAFDLADAFEQMWQKRRYNEIFFMIDTCQANTMYSKLYSPNILATGTAKLAQNLYAYQNDPDIGVDVIDRYTNFVLEYMERVNKTSHDTLEDLFATLDPALIHSEPGVRTDLFARPLDTVRITDFFGGVAQVEVQDRGESMVPRTPVDVPSSNYEDAVEERAAKKLNPPARIHPQTQTQVQRREPWRGVGAWGGVVLLGALVGWVGRKGRKRM
ncbi:peptidase C13 family-domain-containing protein [Mycena crocata]|nr:peptidase C13 family-domain-containing protein [Mycena crocata]